MRVAVLACLALGAAGCILPSPDYDGTEFSCAEPPFTCPGGHTCEQGLCVAEPSELGTPDAGAPVAGDPDATPVSDPPPDAAEPGEPVTITFGERPNADVSNVTTDSAIRQEQPLENYGGRDVVDPDADPLKRGLLRFDTSAVPTSAQIISAELEIYVGDPIEDGDLGVYRLLEDWSENQVNWRDRRNNQRWTSAGAGAGSHAPGMVGSLEAREIGAYTVQLSPTTVQQWVSAPSSNHGVLWMSSSQNGRGAEFESSESNNDDERPLLRITYRP